MEHVVADRNSLNVFPESMSFLYEITSHSKYFYFFPPLKQVLYPMRIFCFWYEIVVRKHTWSDTHFKTMKKKKLKKMLLSSCLYQRSYFFKQEYKPLTHTLAYREANVKMRGPAVGTHSSLMSV